MSDHCRKSIHRPSGLPYEQFTALIDLIAEAVAAKVVAKIEISLPQKFQPAGQPVQAQAPSDGRPRLLRIAQVRDRVGMSQTTIYDRIKKGSFPRQALKGAVAAWLESEIDEWIATRVSERPE